MGIPVFHFCIIMHNDPESLALLHAHKKVAYANHMRRQLLFIRGYEFYSLFHQFRYMKQIHNCS